MIYEIKPTVILAFGRVASDALVALMPFLAHEISAQLIVGPHPTARGIDTISAIRAIRVKLDAAIDAQLNESAAPDTEGKK